MKKKVKRSILSDFILYCKISAETQHDRLYRPDEPESEQVSISFIPTFTTGIKEEKSLVIVVLPFVKLLFLYLLQLVIFVVLLTVITKKTAGTVTQSYKIRSHK